MRVRWLPVLYWFVVAGICAAIVTTQDVGPEEVRAVIRATAFTSAVPFLLAFTAAAFHQFRRTAVTRWLVANRRYLGLSLAASHFWHLVAIISLIRWFSSGSEPVPNLTLIFGSAGFVFIALMAMTSNDASQRALGRAWNWLHVVGLYVIWLDFIFTYMGTALRAPFHLVMTAAFALAWTARVMAFVARRS